MAASRSLAYLAPRASRLLFALAASTVCLVLASCGDGPPLSPERLGWGDRQDAVAVTANPYFAFLPPLAKEVVKNGTFNSRISPRVEICLWDGGQCTSPVAEFTRTSGPRQTPNDRVIVSAEDQQYHVNWQARQFGNLAGRTVRIRVMVGHRQLGSTVALMTAGKPKTLEAGVDLALNPNSTAPIKFWIAHGAVAYAIDPVKAATCIDCVEVTVDESTTTTAETPSDLAAVTVPAGVIPTGTTVMIQQAVVPCLPDPDEQAPYCYSFTTDPVIPQFNGNVVVEVCLQAGYDRERFQLFKYPAGPINGEPYGTGNNVVVALEPAPTDLVTCPGQTAMIRNPLAKLAFVGLRAAAAPLARLFGPSVANASDEGMGGLAGSFSEIGWGAAVTMSKEGGVVGSPILTSSLHQPKVRLYYAHTDDHVGEPLEPVGSGKWVTFNVTNGGGRLGTVLSSVVTQMSAETDAAGYATVPWTLGSSAGLNILSVTVDEKVVPAGGSSAPAALGFVQQDTFSTTSVAPQPSGPQVRITSLSLSSTTATIGENGVPYSASLKNDSSATLSQVVVQAWIEQGTARLAAGGAMVNCGSGFGTFPAGTTCSFLFSLVASNASGGSGTLVAGPATAVFELKADQTVLYSETRAVTLTVDAASYWQAEGHFLDRAGGNDGVPIGGASFTDPTVTSDPGFSGRSFKFDGYDDYIDAPGTGNNVNGATQVTLATWVNISSAAGAITDYRRFITLKGAPNGAEKAVLRANGSTYGGWPGANSLHFYLNTSSGPAEVIVGGLLGARDCFNHVAGTYDGSNLRLYLNGVEVGSTAHSGALVAGDGIRLSNALSPGYGESLNGKMDEVRIYGRALSSTEIQALKSFSGSNKCVQ